MTVSRGRDPGGGKHVVQMFREQYMKARRDARDRPPSGADDDVPVPREAPSQAPCRTCPRASVNGPQDSCAVGSPVNLRGSCASRGRVVLTRGEWKSYTVTESDRA